MITDLEFMQLAWQQARLGANQTWTNPQVGAVLVQAGQVIAQGYHHRFGQAHAEVDTLAQLANDQQAVGATMYVTLEPCSHYGKTPPCADRLVQAGLARVVIGQHDPNPLVAGKGIAILEKAGIAVTLLDDTGGINRAYNFFYRHQRPYVTLKYAASIDGKLNANAPKRTRLSGHAAFLASQARRAEQQAILVGEHTLVIDDPSLTVRTQALAHPPVRIALVRDADALPAELRLWQDASASVWLLSNAASTRAWPAHVQVFAAAEWTPQAVCALMAKHGLQSLQVEGGSRIQAEFLVAGLVEQLLVDVAPITLGGDALPVAKGPAAAAVAWQLAAVERLADDVLLTYRRDE
ncbi:bifunctional diaminohydroxyphosphoribosylaminopyrimidine deaminase/5-amino-6-(5-phosphoribosylamino)uracil reductase RibD [Lacticaseibacillus baoqingensis]|uniref:Riboflavin biosynthesis protein RibD n=1 Tax=Lacticaseibacillus baoqingensis TaxID=2486013 RepID=A0ABW4EBW2_9LACO|nr:bifunctional diaminohydroxyphosphoribosylaminopyrimidine deaminase/5-amino-6-(5-phosphoribosylamino)uracil reductase RibD [Lacticaseibacillus baoqingensis]